MKLEYWRFYLVRNIFTQIIIRAFFFIWDIIILPFKAIFIGFMTALSELVFGIGIAIDNYIKPNPFYVSDNADKCIKNIKEKGDL